MTQDAQYLNLFSISRKWNRTVSSHWCCYSSTPKHSFLCVSKYLICFIQIIFSLKSSRTFAICYSIYCNCAFTWEVHGSYSFWFCYGSFYTWQSWDITPDMAAKGAKETLVNKLGFKSNSSKSADMDIEKLKRENQQLKKSLEDMKKAGRHQHTHPDSDKAKLLEVNSCLLSTWNLMELCLKCQQQKSRCLCHSIIVYRDVYM